MRTCLSHPDLPAATVLDALGSASFEVSAPQRRTRTILDTFDGRLHEAGLRLEAHGPSRPALVLWAEEGAAPARLVGETSPTWPSDLPPGPFRDRVGEVTRERALLPLLRVTSSVATARLLDRRAKTVVVVEVHTDLVGEATTHLPDWVAEVTTMAGHADAAGGVLARLRELGLREHPGDLATLVAAAAGTNLAGRDGSPSVPLDPGEAALAGFRRVLTNLADTVVANLPGTVDDTDPEFLHDLRVAVRRTRSVLTQGKGVLPDDVRAVQREAFAWLGQLTGPARDLDVQVLGWDDHVAPLTPPERAHLEPVRAALETHRRAEHEALRRALRSRRCWTVLDDWRRWLADPEVGASSDIRLGPVVVDRITKAQAGVLRDGRRITPGSAPERLHDLRKDTKKLRYLLECFGSLFPAKDRKAFVSQLKALQDNLGDHQDAEIQLHELRRLAHQLHDEVGTDVILAMGRLSDHLERRREQERQAFAERFAAYDTKANRRTLDRLLRHGSGP